MLTNKIYGLLGISMKAGKIVFGTDSTMDMISRRRVKLVIIAEDSSDRTIRHFKEKCDEYNIPYYIFGNKDEISKAIGKENKAVIGIKNKNLADAIKKILDGGDVIG